MWPFGHRVQGKLGFTRLSAANCCRIVIFSRIFINCSRELIGAITVRIRGILWVLPLLSAFILLSGCGLLPLSGPAGMDILSGQRDQTSLPYALVKVTPKVIQVLSKSGPRLIVFNDRRRPRDITFG